MFNFNDIELTRLAAHKVGNPSQEEDLDISEHVVGLDEDLAGLLYRYFLTPFKVLPSLYHFTHPAEDLSRNEVYYYASRIFENPQDLLKHSQSLAKILYGCSDHPNIKGGEFYVAYFENLFIEREWIESAIGLFKSEHKDNFIRVEDRDQGIELDADEGINIKKLDKGCLILNHEKEEGYVVAVVDNTNKGDEARYWKDEFLGVKPREDNYFHTQNFMQMCRNFTDEIEMERTDKIDLLNHSAKYFTEETTFEKDSFEEKVLQQPEIIDAFEDYKQRYTEEKQLVTFDEFDIAPAAVKKMKRVYKSVIKLDRNFHIYVHGNRSMIEKGFDEERGLNYYKVYYSDES